MEYFHIGIIALVLFFLFLAIGLPVAFGLTIVSFLGMLYIVGWETTIVNMSTVFFYFIASYTMSVILAFVLMGQLAYESGLLVEIFEVAQKWLRRLPGALGISTVAANSIFAACSGSSVAACIVVGKASIPVMRKAGYPETVSMGIVAASGTFAVLIPPSITICIYGLLVEQSIGELLIGGILPGIVSAVLYMAFIAFRCRHIARSTEVFTWKERFASVRHLWILAVVIAGVLGSIYLGVATPTEAGSVGAFIVLVLTIVMRRMNLTVLKSTITGTVKTCGMVLFIIAAAAFFSRFLVLSGFTGAITDTIAGMQIHRFAIFGLVTVVYLFLGCFMTAVGMMVVSLPMFFPLMMALGFDPIWFGIIVVKYVEMALITPPVGMNVYAVHSIFPEVSIEKIFRGASYFLIMDLLTIGVLTAFPQIVTLLPNLMMR